LLVSVRDGDDPKSYRLQVGYGRTSPADWAGSACAFPTLCGHQGMQVVAWTAGLDVATTTHYRFEEPRMDLYGRGFLGFATVRLWSPERPLERTTTFDNKTRVGTFYPNAYRPKSIRSVVPIVAHGPDGEVGEPVGSAARISETSYDYEVRAPAGSPSHFIYT